MQFPRPKIRRILAETGRGGSGGEAVLPRHQQLLEVLLPGHKIARVEYIELESERDGAPQAAITKARKNRPDTQKALLSARSISAA